VRSLRAQKSYAEVKARASLAETYGQKISVYRCVRSRDVAKYGQTTVPSAGGVLKAIRPSQLLPNRSY
jgi:hypothetical protein